MIWELSHTVAVPLCHPQLCAGAQEPRAVTPGSLETIQEQSMHTGRRLSFYCLFALIEACRSPLSPGGIDLSSRKAQENTRPPFAPLPLSVPRLQAQEKKSQSQLPVRSGPVPSTLVCSVSAVKPAPSLSLGGVGTLFKPSARTFFLRSRMCVPFA